MREILATLLAFLAPSRRQPAPDPVICRACPDEIDLRAPHVTLLHHSEVQTARGNVQVLKATPLGTFHYTCAYRAQVTVSPNRAHRRVVASTEPDPIARLRSLGGLWRRGARMDATVDRPEALGLLVREVLAHYDSVCAELIELQKGGPFAGLPKAEPWTPASKVGNRG